MSGIIARMSKRPWSVTEKTHELETVRFINELKNGNLRVLVRVMHETLTGPQRSIAFGNLNKAVRKNERVTVLGGTVKSTICGLDGMRRQLSKCVKEWAKSWEEEHNKLVVVKLVIATSASRSMRDTLENTTASSKKNPRDDD